MKWFQFASATIGFFRLMSDKRKGRPHGPPG